MPFGDLYREVQPGRLIHKLKICGEDLHGEHPQQHLHKNVMGSKFSFALQCCRSSFKCAELFTEKNSCHFTGHQKRSSQSSIVEENEESKV